MFNFVQTYQDLSCVVYTASTKYTIYVLGDIVTLLYRLTSKLTQAQGAPSSIEDCSRDKGTGHILV